MRLVLFDGTWGMAGREGADDVIDQGCAAPINCSMFLVVMTLLKGGGFGDAVQTVHDVCVPSCP